MVPQPQPLSASGPWVVYPYHDGVYIANDDGRGMSLLHPFQVASPYVAASKIAAAPQGGRIAVLELINIEQSVINAKPQGDQSAPGEVDLELQLTPRIGTG